jgi:hypothetical protein
MAADGSCLIPQFRNTVSSIITNNHIHLAHVPVQGLLRWPIPLLRSSKNEAGHDQLEWGTLQEAAEVTIETIEHSS